MLILLGLTAVASATDALEESGLLIKGVSKTIKRKKKNKRADFSVYQWQH